MAIVHPSAVVSPLAEIADDVVIGPFCVVEQDVKLGAGCRLETHVAIKSGTIMGKQNHIFDGAVIGGYPQHLKAAKVGKLVIGDHNTIRENATIHRGLTPAEDTHVGNNNFIMINVHIAHDCNIGDHTIIANNVLLAGHIIVQDRAYLSGAAAAHQFARIGKYAMVGGQAHAARDVPPYVTVDGDSSCVVGLNTIGLRRNGFTTEDINQIKEAYRIIYRRGLKWDDMLATLRDTFTHGPAAAYYPFLAETKRGILPARATPKAVTIKLPETTPDGTGEIRKAG